MISGGMVKKLPFGGLKKKIVHRHHFIKCHCSSANVKTDLQRTVNKKLIRRQNKTLLELLKER